MSGVTSEIVATTGLNSEDWTPRELRHNFTPEQVRGHALVRQLVSDLLTMQASPSSELRDLAERLASAELSNGPFHDRKGL